MRTSYLTPLAGIIAVLAALSAPAAAFGQYVWLDEKGVKQFSDVPPPSSVPANRILKQPGERPRLTGDTSTADGAAANAAPAPKTLAEQNAEFNKRRAEQAEKEKKAADEARLAAEKSKNCDRARNYQRALESGGRIAQVNKDGERVYLTDEQRSHELREASQMLQDCK